MEEYLKEIGMRGSILEMTLEKFAGQKDIADEFERWIKTGKYGDLEVEGYTAARIKELAPFMNGCGVYSFLITLREEPETAKKYIEEGFRRK